jgi:hypothetical protein
MKQVLPVALCALLALISCASDDASPTNPSQQGGQAGSGSVAGASGSAQAGTAGQAGVGATGGNSGSGGVSGSSGAAGSTGTAGSSGTGGASGNSSDCASEREKLLQPVAKVSTGEVIVISDTAGTKVLYIDASAGGTQGQTTNPRVYVDLEQGKRVDVSDITAQESLLWDLAIKRPVLFTNGGQGGPGQGGSYFLANKSFDEVASADLMGITFNHEKFLSVDCVASVDQMGAIKTTFVGWYEYDTSTNSLSPAPGTYLVKGGSGKVFKIQLLSYYANPDGSTGTIGGRYLIKSALLP